MKDGEQELCWALDPVRFAREKLGFTADPKQALVLGRKVRRGVLNCSRQWGKSTVAAIKSVHRASFLPGALTVVVSPSERQSGEFVRKAGVFVRKLGLRTRGDGDNSVSLLFPNGSRIVGFPGTESTVRGFSSVSLMLIDEASRVSDELYKAVRPMLAVGDGDLWLLSTPFGKRGFFYETWVGGGEEWTRVRAPATECPRISPAFLEDERKVMGDRWFRQEYLCEFVETDDSAFSEEWLKRAITPAVSPLFDGDLTPIGGGGGKDHGGR